MNNRIKELMLQAGYAAPELAGRANRLADLLVEDVTATMQQFLMMQVDPSIVAGLVKQKYGITNEKS